MAYQGVKFRTVFRSHDAPSHPKLEELKKWCSLFQKTGLTPAYESGTYGNLSFRSEDFEQGFIITGSCLGRKDELEDRCFVEVASVDGKAGIVYAIGTREPSSEAMLHAAIYDKRSEVNAVFHGHCDKILQSAEKLGLPVTEKEEAYGTKELVDSVMKILGNKQFVIMRNHGFISIGGSMEEAGSAALDMLKKCSPGRTAEDR